MSLTAEDLPPSTYFTSYDTVYKRNIHTYQDDDSVLCYESVRAYGVEMDGRHGMTLRQWRTVFSDYRVLLDVPFIDKRNENVHFEVTITRECKNPAGPFGPGGALEIWEIEKGVDEIKL